MPQIKLIAAIDYKRGIARGGRIPWDLPSDKKHWHSHTLGQTVIMGANTYEKLNKKFLSRRQPFVVTRDTKPLEVGEIINNLPAFLQNIRDDVWVIGGGQIFELALPHATELYLTRVKGDFQCDVFFPEFELKFKLQSQSEIMQENNINFRYEHWVK
ncbi:MAG: dihydrofolate reductase [bacterium]|nr:dihydrofolate reductase [bacterium]